MKILILMAVGLLLAGCQATGKNPKEENKGAEQEKTLTIEVIQPELQQGVYQLNLAAELSPYESVEVYAKVKGFVKKIFVDVGDVVKKGQVLAVLEAPEMDLQSTADQARTQQLEANYGVSKRRYDRLKKVQEQQSGAISSLELEQAEGEMLKDQASLEESKFAHRKTQQMQAYLTVQAPFAGVITARNFSVGALLGDAGVPVFRLVENDRLKLKVTVPEVHAQSISDSTIANFSVLSKPEQSYEARVKRNAKVIDPITKALALEFDVPNPKKELNGGDYADVVLQLKRNRPTYLVPKSAVIRTQAGIYVLKLDDQHQVIRQMVKLGETFDDQVEVFGALKLEDRLVKNANEEINNGQKIQIVK